MSEMTSQGQNRGHERPNDKPSPYSDASLATCCDRLALPHQFAAPAQALVTLMQLPAGGLVLDVGSGTGAVTIPAADVVGSRGCVVSLDPSVEMLRLLQTKGVHNLVAGKVPGLPFRESLFDAVLASFVLSHFADYRVALADMVRVLRPSCRLGVTAWAPAQTEFAQLWKEVTGQFTSLEVHQQAFRSVIPWDEWFMDGRHLRQALEEAGLVHVEVEDRSFLVKLSVADYVAIREGSVEGTLVRHMLEPERWNEFRQTMLEAFQSRFDAVEYWRDVHFACGVKRQ